MRSPLPRLTNREIDVVKLIWEELTTQERAERLDISPRTVEAHRWNICHKLSVRSSVGIIKFALKTNIVQMEQLKIESES
jgi:DNA-binding CsgD family transcriptional regulator